MARKRSSGESGPASSGGGGGAQGLLLTFRPGALAPGSVAETARFLADVIGAKHTAFAADFEGSALDFERTEDADVVVMNALAVAVADLDPDQRASLSAAVGGGDTAISAIEPEPIFFAFHDGAPVDLYAYLRGYRDAVNQLGGALLGEGAGLVAPPAFPAAPCLGDSDVATWGLQAAGVPASRLSGRGVRLCVLDTGIDLDHPDFRGRPIVAQSFVAGQSVDDDNGHGTHCAGTAAGPRAPVRGPRYGTAYDADLFVGKVLANEGSSRGRSTIAGIEWAVANACRIVSMSLGSRVLPGQPFLQAFEQVALQALSRGTLIVAAAGNDSRRSRGTVEPVGSPANCPSIMAVAAVDSCLRVADFSNGSINPDGRVDVSAPGVDVYSSAPEPAATPRPPDFRRWPSQYERLSGTSMATPHVAGIAALYAEERPDLDASGLWRMLTARSRPLPAFAGDVGAGLVQA